MRHLICTLVFVFAALMLMAQHEYIGPLGYNPALKQGPDISSHAANKAPGDTLPFPFIDDFSYQQTKYPDSRRWFDKQVYINNTYPVNQRSYGVATFDGLNEFGQPYGIDPTGVLSTRQYGPADTLTSKYIDLSGKSLQDSVYLKFTYQPGGVGDPPNREDSLVLEFKKNTSWVKVWGTPGISDTTGISTFIDTAVLVDDAFYFVPDFQFRFRNNATIIGNNDHWHLDYVYLKDSTSTTGFDDMAVQTEPTNLLKNYTMMPWHQFQGFEAQEAISDITFCFNNNYNSVRSSFFGYTTVEELSQTPVFTRPPSAGNFNFLANADTCFTLDASDIISNLPNTNADSLVIATTVTINKQNTDITTENDTITGRTKFFNLFAYDDGSAEKEYGLRGGNTQIKKFAYEFVLNKPDTLRAVQMHFTRIDFNPALEVFSFYIWRKLDLGNVGAVEDTLYFEDFRSPMYVDSVNAFATFRLPEPLLIADTVYIGWQQITDKSIGIGLDVNNDATEHMYYFANSKWYPSSLYGAPMIRPLVGKDVLIPATGIAEALRGEDKHLVVYPNPANSILQFNISGITDLQQTEIQVYDLSGRLVMAPATGNTQLDIAALQPGMYLIKMQAEGEHFVSRFIKQ